MDTNTQLLILKAVHTLVVLGSASSTCYIIYCGVRNRLGRWLWAAMAYVGLIGVLLVVNNNRCPLQNLARAIAGTTQWVPDLFLPNWVARLIVPVLAPLDVLGYALVAWRVIQRRHRSPGG